MGAKKRGLGRGLDALLGSTAGSGGAAAVPAGKQPAAAPALKAVPADVSAVTGAERADGDLCTLPVDIIRRGKYQPRIDMHKETLQDLADSISAQGVLQPIVVRAAGAGKYEIIAGERRWRAAQLAGLHEIPAIVREVEDRAAIAIALIENIQRENLNPLEEARALDRLIREFELTHEQAAEAVGRSRAAVSNLLRLLELEDSVKYMVEQGVLEMGHARALLALSGTRQVEAARQVKARGLSVRATEGLVRQLQQPRKARPATAPKDPDIQRLESDLADKLGASVLIRAGRSGKGKLEISYNSLDELDGILAHIR
ncbi:MAG: ParB/RepB/Spo0J family partition protein [Gammaproteobacteria bacterium]|nr:ParB/RepB/Spo0J family partition protein [Gammaproteobacteria bacterium]